MTAVGLRKLAYRLATGLALVYVVYVVVLKFSGRVMGGPLGELGETLLMLAAVTSFSVGLFADEAACKPGPSAGPDPADSPR